MPVKGFDCYGPQTLAKYDEFKNSGYSFVGRYYAKKGSPKLLTKQDALNISKAGLEIIPVFETNPTKADYFTYDRGKSDLLEAAARAAEVGQPPRTTIYFAVDFDASVSKMAEVAKYFTGICDAMKEYTANDSQKRSWNIGIYGGYTPCTYISKYVKGVTYFWQTYAWSRGKIFPLYNVYQYKNDVNELGVNIDMDRGNGLRSSGIGGFKISN